MSNIHPTAIISKNTNIDKTVKIGPYCVIGDNVTLKANVTLISHVTIDKNTEVDEGTTIYPFAVIGFRPQDLKFEEEETRVVIGKNNTIREYVSIHIATKVNPTLTTTIGDNCLLMGGVHIAHDCKIGNNVIIANPTVLGGHVIVEDYAIIGGASAIHQFSRIGKLAFIGGGSLVTEDIVPYALYSGTRDSGFINGVNLTGLKRHNYPRQDIINIREAYKILFTSKVSLKERVSIIENQFRDNKIIEHLINFIKEDTSRHLNMKFGKSGQQSS